MPEETEVADEQQVNEPTETDEGFESEEEEDEFFNEVASGDDPTATDFDRTDEEPDPEKADEPDAGGGDDSGDEGKPGEQAADPEDDGKEKESEASAEDEVTARGKAILDAQEKARKEEEDRKAAEAAGGEDEETVPDVSAASDYLRERLKGVKFKAKDDDGEDIEYEGLDGFSEQFGEDVAAFVAASVAAVKDDLKKEIQETTKPYEAMHEKEQTRAAVDALAKELRKEENGGHKDAKDILNGDDWPEFWAGLTPAQQALGSPDQTPEDAVKNADLLMRMYKEKHGKPTKSTPPTSRATKTKAQQRKKKEQTDRLHKSTTRTRRTAPRAENKDLTSEDEDAIFAEEARAAVA